MIEILKYTLPALIVLLAAWIVLHKMLKEERERRDFELRKHDRSVTTPIRLRGYERLTLMLERIEPEHLLLNLELDDISLRDLQKHLLQAVRLETDHNLSQQIYVSNEAWQMIMVARDEMANFITTIALQMPEGSTALLYAQTLITAYNENGETPTQRAKQQLRAEASRLM